MGFLWSFGIDAREFTAENRDVCVVELLNYRGVDSSVETGMQR